MCFSANASFTASAALVPTGGWCILSVLRQRKLRYLPLAFVPLIFALQQFLEGMVWKGIGAGDAEMTRRFSQLFLFFALSFWPFWMPFVALNIEKRLWKQAVMCFLMVLGVIMGDYLYGQIINEPERWLKIEVVCRSIRYTYFGGVAFQFLPTVVSRSLYVVVGGLPLFLCSEAIVRRFGALMVFSAFMTGLFYSYAFTSVWCLFAALLSLYLCGALQSPEQRSFWNDWCAAGASRLHLRDAWIRLKTFLGV